MRVISSSACPDVQLENAGLCFELEITKVRHYLSIVDGRPISVIELQLHTTWWNVLAFTSMTFDNKVVKLKYSCDSCIGWEMTELNIIQIVERLSGSDEP